MDMQITQILVNKQKYDEKYSQLMLDFIAKAYTLVEQSQDLYQVESTIMLNQISLKDYLLNSAICQQLNKQGIVDYTDEYLEQVIAEYEREDTADVTAYALALELYQQLDQIKKVEEDCINYEKSCLNEWFSELSQLDNVEKTLIKSYMIIPYYNWKPNI